MRRFAVPAVVTLSLSVIAGSARAEPANAAPSAEAMQPAPAPAGVSAPSLRVDVGLFSPVGELGVVYGRPTTRLTAVEVGMGAGFSGLQLSAMGKLRLGNDRTNFTPGLGVSVGLPILGTKIHSGHPAGDDEAMGSPVTMVWLDADLLGLEHRTRSGVLIAASVGVTCALTEGHWDAVDLGQDVERFDLLPQARLGIGKAF